MPHDECSCGFSYCASTFRCVQEAHDCVREVTRRIGQQQLAPVRHGVTLGPHASGDEWFPHCHRLQKLESRSASNTERRDIDCGLCDVGLDGFDVPCQ